MKAGIPSSQNVGNWFVDVVLFLPVLVATLSGIYFLLLPSGGHQGGRNPWHHVSFVFSRGDWDTLHAWGGLLMIVAAVIHLAMHWGWVRMMARRWVSSLLGRGCLFTRRLAGSLIPDAVVLLSFLAVSSSGNYLLLASSGGFRGGRNVGWDPGLLLPRPIWDLVHTWAGVLLILIGAAAGRFWIHWRWVKNMTRRIVRAVLDGSEPDAMSSGARAR